MPQIHTFGTRLVCGDMDAPAQDVQFNRFLLIQLAICKFFCSMTFATGSSYIPQSFRIDRPSSRGGKVTCNRAPVSDLLLGKGFRGESAFLGVVVSRCSCVIWVQAGFSLTGNAHLVSPSAFRFSEGRCGYRLYRLLLRRIN